MPAWLRHLLRRAPSGPVWVPPTGEYVERDFGVAASRTGELRQWDLDGVEWSAAPMPPTEHVCYVHTRAHMHWFTVLERCACGGVCYDHRKTDPGHIWLERNTRTDYGSDHPPMPTTYVTGTS